MMQATTGRRTFRRWYAVAGAAAMLASSAQAEDYGGQALDADWRQQADARIDQHRKADIVFQLVEDDEVTGVAFQRVTVRMTRHGFPFTIAYNIPGLQRTEGEPGASNRLVTGGLFNTLKGVNAKVEIWDGDNRAGHLRDFEFFLGTGLAFRGNQVMYRRRELFDGLQDQALVDAILARWGEMLDEEIADGQTIGSVAISWNIINETYGGGDVYPNLSSRNSESERRDRIAHALRQADAWRRQGRIRPDAKFVIHEARVLSQLGIAHNKADKGNRHDYYERLLRDLIARDAPFDAIGFQSHHSQDMTDMDEVWRLLERFAGLGKELMVTEYDIRIGGSYAESHTPEQVMALEAQYTRDFMTLTFSHPQVTSFDVWQTYDGKHWKNNALFLADGEGDGDLQDLQLKPSGEAFADLVLREWWTHETVLSDHAGGVSLRGFLGDYELTIERPGRDVVRIPAVLTPEGLQTRDGAPLRRVRVDGTILSEARPRTTSRGR